MTLSVKPVDSRNAVPPPASVSNSLFLNFSAADKISFIVNSLKNKKAVAYEKLM